MIDLGQDVLIETSALTFGENDLLPEEKQLCARAVEKRKKEVAAGRVLARRLLKKLGYPERPLLNTPDRAPIWPEGVSGSIAHSRSLCIVAMSKAQNIRTLGVDTEEEAPLPDELFGLVLVGEETRWLAAQPASERGVLAKLIFSAKECAYKAQFPLTKKILEFSEVTIELDLRANKFTASILPNDSGVFSRDGKHLVTGMRVRRV
jgi:4'-phosphopantetheinyl transferase EntD